MRALKKAQEDNIKLGYGRIKWKEDDYKKTLKIINKKKAKAEDEKTKKSMTYIRNSTMF